MSATTISYSSELMQNYLQAEILAPDAKFQALQTDDGASLLFSIGTDAALYLTQESPGTRSGWTRTDLSSAQIAKDFPGQSGVTCKDFACAQALNSIHLGMVVADPADDHLYLSLQNPDTWTGQPPWTAYPFDDPAHPQSTVKIVGVEISEATDAEYIVVDIVRDPSSSLQLISRYYIDPAKSNGHAWVPHDVAVDLQVGAYSSCLGRRLARDVDGLYTAGTVAGAAQFTYQPLYNAFKPGFPAPVYRFSLPGGAAPDAIATCRNADESTDLYATANQTLYYLASGSQQDGATMVALFSSPSLNGVHDLFAAVDGSNVTIWGRNANDEVFYTACARSQISAGSVAWSVPLAILTGVEQVSPYIDRANSANTFFAHTGTNELVKAVKSPGTTIWTLSDITLDPPATTTPAQRFSSYTTRVQLTGADGQPAAGVPLTLSASNVTGVRINSLYYMVGPSPIQVDTDPVGAVTIVETLQSPAGTRLTVSADGVQTTINPMDGAFAKASSLTTPALLSAATITNADGTTRPLVAPGTSNDALQTVATANGQLAQAYAALPGGPPRLAVAAAAVPGSSLGGVDSILVDAGDLFSWLAHKVEEGVDYVVNLVEDAATKAWNFAVKLAGEAYHAVLDCAEKVVGALEWLYAAIKTGVEDLLKYLEFLFGWADIKRTKNVIANLIAQFLNHQVDQIEVVKGEFDAMIAAAEQAIDGWAGVDGWAGLGADGNATANSQSTPAAGQTAPGSLLLHHYQGNAQATTQLSPPPAVNPPSNPVTVLLDAITAEADTIGDTITRLHTLAADFDTTPIVDVLKELVAIVADLVLESARHVIDALFDILYDIAKAALSVIDTPIHIPVVSDILSDIGIPEFSILDVICWIGAIPITLGYKLAHGTAPFPDSPEVDFLASTDDWAALQQSFSTPSGNGNGSGPALRAPMATVVKAAGPIAMPAGVAEAVHVTGHAISGVCSLASAVISFEEAKDPNPDNAWGMPSAVAGIVGGVTAGVANVLVPHDAVKNSAVSWISTATTSVRILCKVIFSGPAQSKFDGTFALNMLKVSDGRGVGSIVDAVLVIPALACTCWHFYELAGEPAGADRSIAIVDETASMTSYISRVGYAVAVNVEDPDVKAVALAGMTVANVCTGGLQIAEAAIA